MFWAFWLWLAGAAAILVRLLADRVRIGVLTRRSRPGSPAATGTMDELARQLGLRVAVRLAYSDAVAMPLTWGFVRPVVMLPASAQDWPEERLRVVILHELAHIKRGDYLTHLLTRFTCACYWLNPLVWAAARRIGIERERACDDLVLQAGTRSSVYAGHLLDIARAFQATAPPLRGAIGMARRSTLKERIRAILNTESNRRALTTRAAILTALVLLCISLPVSALQVWKENRAAEQAGTAPLIEALADADPTVRQRAAWSLGEKEDPEALKALVARLRDDDPGVRGMAAWALGEIKDRRALPALLMARHDPDVYVRDMVARAIGEHQDVHTVPALVEMLGDTDAGVRTAAAWALGEIGPAAVPALAEAMLHHPDYRVALKAAQTLRATRLPSTVPAFADALKRNNSDLKVTAIRALAELGGPDAVEALTRALDDASGGIRSMAVSALESLDDPAAVPAIIRALDDKNREVQTTAANALTRKPDLRALEPLRAQLLEGYYPEVRAIAARALGGLPLPRAVDALILALYDQFPDVRLAAASALGRIGDPRAVDALIPLLRDPDPEVRAAVVSALDEINPSRIAEPAGRYSGTRSP
jgi:HEAT repeat protein